MYIFTFYFICILSVCQSFFLLFFLLMKYTLFYKFIVESITDTFIFCYFFPLTHFFLPPPSLHCIVVCVSELCINAYKLLQLISTPLTFPLKYIILYWDTYFKMFFSKCLILINPDFYSLKYVYFIFAHSSLQF